MHVLIVNNTQIPANLYGGTERIIWWLGKELVNKGHRVTYLVKEGSTCDFAEVLVLQPDKDLQHQIPPNVDIVHFHFIADVLKDIPSITTIHGNISYGINLPVNSVFVSQNHSKRYGSDVFVYNGLDFTDYGDPGLNTKREHYHFLGKAAWRVKNVRGAISISNICKEKLVVIGGYRINLKMGLRITPFLNVKFKGIIGGEEKNELLRSSKGLLFPVLWHEPFGVAIIESLYFGCPVFGTPYGSLPELVTEEVGFLSPSKVALANKINENDYSPQKCHNYALKNFNSDLMSNKYLNLYKKAINGENLSTSPPSLQIDQKEKFLPFY